MRTQDSLQKQPMKTFLMIWMGQLISEMGSAMTSFALLIWAYERTGKATTLAMLGFFGCISYAITASFAGVYVDRWNRRLIMIVADFGAGLMTLFLLILFIAGHLQIWHFYLVQTVSGVFRAFQSPAYAASVSMLVPQEQLTRVNGMISFSNYSSTALAPICAALLLAVSDLSLILMIDIVSMLIAVTTLLFVIIPQPEGKPKSRMMLMDLLRESRFGIRFIFSYTGLRGILAIYFCINLFGTITYLAILSPMILARSAGDTVVLSAVQTAMGIGGIAGALLVSLWGSSKNRVKTFLLATMASFLVSDLLFAVGQSLIVWIIAGAFCTLTIPFISSPYFAIWQIKVPAALQGRVFSVRNMFQVGSQPIGYLLGGILADYVFEPAMLSGGVLEPIFGWLVGTGPGTGMGVMFLFTCIMGSLTGLCGFFIPAVRNVETDLPNAVHLI